MDKLGRLEKLYEFRDGIFVRRFIEEHTFLLELVEEAYTKIATCFGANVPVFLEVMADPESTQDDLELVAFVQSHMSVEDSLKALERFDEEWWLDTMPRAKGLFAVHLEFK